MGRRRNKAGAVGTFLGGHTHPKTKDREGSRGEQDKSVWGRGNPRAKALVQKTARHWEELQ